MDSAAGTDADAKPDGGMALAHFRRRPVVQCAGFHKDERVTGFPDLALTRAVQRATYGDERPGGVVQGLDKPGHARDEAAGHGLPQPRPLRGIKRIRKDAYLGVVSKVAHRNDPTAPDHFQVAEVGWRRRDLFRCRVDAGRRGYLVDGRWRARCQGLSRSSCNSWRSVEKKPAKSTCFFDATFRRPSFFVQFVAT